MYRTLFLSPVSHPSFSIFHMYSRGFRNFLVVKILFFTLYVKCHMFNFTWHYVILLRMPRVRCITDAIKNKPIIKYFLLFLLKSKNHFLQYPIINSILMNFFFFKIKFNKNYKIKKFLKKSYNPNF
jgi:hypothetical protein